jgi:ArsR family transcriptional regulator, lead/cadmium/zinc/bismuth-responsive transcriptional repressor
LASLAVGDALCQVDCVHPEAVTRARASLKEPVIYRDLAALFGALADPTRARIVHALLHQELCSCDLAALMSISKSGASQHLRVLRTLHLVKSRRAGKFVYYSLDDAHIALLLQVGLTHLGHGEAEHLPAVPAGMAVMGAR